MSGKHKNPRRLLGASPEQWARWKLEAEKNGVTLNEWLRTVADDRAANAEIVRDSLRTQLSKGWMP